jgi:hypothetical protein
MKPFMPLSLITGDQFEDTNEGVVITKTDSRRYGTFDKSILEEADYRMIATRDVRAHLEAVYDYVLEADKHDR